MGHIAIKLNPAGLVNPDLDMRDRIPDLIRDVTEGRIRDDGYDYQDGDTLVVFLSCDDPQSDVEDVIAALAANRICEDRVLDFAVIGVSDDRTTFKIVHPATNGGTFSRFRLGDERTVELCDTRSSRRHDVFFEWMPNDRRTIDCNRSSGRTVN